MFALFSSSSSGFEIAIYVFSCFTRKVIVAKQMPQTLALVKECPLAEREFDVLEEVVVTRLSKITKAGTISTATNILEELSTQYSRDGNEAEHDVLFVWGCEALKTTLAMRKSGSVGLSVLQAWYIVPRADRLIYSIESGGGSGWIVCGISLDRKVYHAVWLNSLQVGDLSVFIS